MPQNEEIRLTPAQAVQFNAIADTLREVSVQIARFKNSFAEGTAGREYVRNFVAKPVRDAIDCLNGL